MLSIESNTRTHYILRIMQEYGFSREMTNKVCLLDCQVILEPIMTSLKNKKSSYVNKKTYTAQEIGFWTKRIMLKTPVSNWLAGNTLCPGKLMHKSSFLHFSSCSEPNVFAYADFVFCVSVLVFHCLFIGFRLSLVAFCFVCELDTLSKLPK